MAGIRKLDGAKAKPMIATCPKTEVLRDFASGKLSDSQSDSVTDHIRDCTDCQQQLAQIDGVEDTLVGYLRDSTVNESFQKESQCQVAMARALGALANAEHLDQTTDGVPLPRSIGEYDIVREIGRGGMGSVYLAQHTKLDRKVAIKVLAANRIADPRMHERFKTEMRAIGSLSHPNIVTAHDAREVDGVALLVTEWIDGLDLREILHRTGPLSVANACAICCEVAKALQYVADRDLVHRDLKPSNVMLNTDGEVKLLDLGLARILSGDNPQTDATATGQAIGTADYVAPEQINDAHKVDIRADIYGLGCTLYKLLAGEAPFDNAQYPTAFAKMTAHVSVSPSPLRSIAPHVPVTVANLVHRMLAKSPEDRPATPEQILRVLSPHAKGADLGQLVQTARSINPTQNRESLMQAPIAATPATFWQRRVPISLLIATGLVGLIIGWIAGITITIRRPDGNTTAIKTPDNTKKIDIDEHGNTAIELARSATDPPASESASDAERISGVWKVEAINVGGKTTAVTDSKSMTFHASKFAVFDGKRATAFGSLVIDPQAKTMKMTEIAGGSMTKHARYRFLPDDQLEMRMNAVDSNNVPAAAAPATNSSSDEHVYLLSKVAIPGDTAAMEMFLSDPDNRDLLQAISMRQSWIQNPSSPEAFAAVMERARSAVDRSQSMLHMKQIAIAFHNFHEVYQVFPASASLHMGSVKKGKKVQPHSWRVAILPFIEQNELYEQYRFDEPWDSEYNLTLLNKMPELYRGPGDSKDSTATNYVGFVGEGTALGSSEGVAMRTITDGTTNTVLLVEAESEIPWTKPEDFSLDPFPSLDRFGKDSVRTVMADGAVKELTPVSEDSIRKAVIGNDGHSPRHR